MSDKIKIIYRSIILALCGFALIMGAREAFKLYQDFYDKQEAVGLLSKDLTAAEDYGKLTKKKLNDLNDQYADILKKYDASITAYTELNAKYEYTKKELAKAQSTIPNTTPTSVPCPDGQCTKDICAPLFAGELIKSSMQDFHLKIDFSAIRKNGFDWEATYEYSLSQKFHLELIEITTSDGHKETQAKIYEVTPDGMSDPLTITDFKYANIDNTAFGMQWWAPTLILGIHQPLFSQTDWYPKPFLAVSISKLGRPTHDDLFRFFQFGIGLAKESKVMFLFTPATYNLGTDLPLIHDLWIGLDLGLDIGAHWSVGVSLSTGL
jgi:hypothetical protein